MFVARSFAFTSPLQPAATDKPAQRSRSPRRTAYAAKTPPFPLPRTHEPSHDRNLPAAEVPPPSSPVPVPPSPRSAASSRHSSRPSSRQGYPFPIAESGSLTSQLEQAAAQPSPGKHDAAALPPAVAALLAMTAIPPHRKGQKRRQVQAPSTRPRHMSLSELVDEWHAMDLGDASSFSPSSPAMEFLLSSPDHESALARSPSDDELPDRFTFAARSQSDDSIPSLDSECRSLQSAVDPVTPLPSAPSGGETSSVKSVGSARREKDKWSPRSVDCACDHPLLQTSVPDSPDTDSSPLSPPRQRHLERKLHHRALHRQHHRHYHPRHLLQHVPSRQRLQPSSHPSVQPVKYQTSKSWRPLSNFRSNLTASLETLKSAATSISNFTAPSLTPDDYLSQSLFDTITPYRSEVRPRFSGIPNAQVRRYFNPGPPPAGDTPLEFHLHNSYIDQTDLLTVSLDPTDTSHEHVIPMQTYIRATPPHQTSDGSTGQSVSQSAIDLLPGL
ncbi:MAG: hypothetical protein INR71_11925, partial [Terriglobus roseus]|nr:hypothetical protein [Terriglobus roseus]